MATSKRTGPESPSAPSDTELERLLVALRALESGDFSVRVALGGHPLMIQIAETFNSISRTNEHLMDEVVRVSTLVGREGQMDVRVDAGDRIEPE